MKTHTDRRQEDKSQSTVNGFAKLQSEGGSSFQFKDNRSEAIQKPRLQKMTKNNADTQQSLVFQDGGSLRSQAQLSQTIRKNKNNDADIFQRVSYLDTDDYRRIYNYSRLWRSGNAVRVLEQIRDDFGVGSDSDYTILSQSDWKSAAKKMGYSADPSHREGGTVGGLGSSQKTIPIVFISEALIKQNLIDRDPPSVAKVVATLRHEYQHVKQKNSKSYASEYKSGGSLRELSEFEAYLSELESSVRDYRGGESAVDQSQIHEAVYNARRHFDDYVAGFYPGYDRILDEMLAPLSRAIEKGSVGMLESSPIDIVVGVMDKHGLDRMVRRIR